MTVCFFVFFWFSVVCVSFCQIFPFGLGFVYFSYFFVSWFGLFGPKRKLTCAESRRDDG